MTHSKYDPNVVYEIPLNQITVGRFKQRFDVDPLGIESLAASISRMGLINPVELSPADDGFILRIGHRRFAAVTSLGAETISAFIRPLPELSAFQRVVAENTDRQDLSPVEIANNIFEMHNTENLSIAEISAVYRRGEAWVRSFLVMTQWPECLIQAVHTGDLSKSAAEKLSVITDMETLEFLTHQAVESGASARVCQSWADSWRAQVPPSDIPHQPEPESQSIVQPLSLTMPCLGCTHDFPPDALAHCYICPNCVSLLRSGALTPSPSSSAIPQQG